MERTPVETFLLPRHSQNYLDKKPFEGDSREVAKKGVPPILRV
jgi:hypothetical protein